MTEFFVHPSTPARGPECGIGSLKFATCGTVLNLASRLLRTQKFVFIADMANNKVWIVNPQEWDYSRLDSEITSRMAGQFHYIDGIAADSHGNIYTGEVETGKRIQKVFVPVNNGKAKR